MNHIYFQQIWLVVECWDMWPQEAKFMARISSLYSMEYLDNLEQFLAQSPMNQMHIEGSYKFKKVNWLLMQKKTDSVLSCN